MRACVEGGWWSAARLQLHRLVAHDQCRCGKAADTLWHRLARCERTEEGRAATCSEKLIGLARTRVWDPPFSRGVPARPKVPQPPKARQWFEKLSIEAELIAEGVVYTDGSAEGWHWKGARARYGAVSYTCEGKPLWVMRGICGEAHPSINRAELAAVCAVLRVCAGAVIIKTDSAFVIRGHENGKEATTAATHEAADLWRTFWWLMEEIKGAGGQEHKGIVIQKVKAHTTWSDVMEGKARQFDYVGNAAADKAAKEALAVAKAEALAEAFNAAVATAVLWAKWMVGYSAIWDPVCPQTEEAVEDMLERLEDEEEGEKTRRNTTTHELWRNNKGTRCRRCGRASTEQKLAPTFGSDACKGSAEGKILASNTGNINFLWSKYLLDKAQMAREGYLLLKATKIPTAAIDESRLQEVTQGGWEGVAGTEVIVRSTLGQGTVNEEGGETCPPQQQLSDRQGEGTEGQEVDIRSEAGGPETWQMAQPGKHSIRSNGRMLWCDRCGAYSTQRAGARLRGTCQVAPISRHRATRLARLRAGRHPLTNAPE